MTVLHLFNADPASVHGGHGLTSAIIPFSFVHQCHYIS
ncbi:hypothetical protein BCE_0938 [Bacillus cereus ATCC 10987]|uniref:Uncharacterized protein n=1 Tax=Bacillus cereus (strain ATCC 10987 / NRS 248) TaxID=222523 RepID=Q73CX6_BACC1|nr:hypothetical protein BCE_0938 [Bacillus cereus ATCC 10987]